MKVSETEREFPAKPAWMFAPINFGFKLFFDIFDHESVLLRNRP